MAHKTLIGGTAYTIKGGKDLIDGTSYAKKQGKALVAGTAQTIAFLKKINVTITGNGGDSLAYVTYKGTKYISATTLEADVGDTITLAAAVFSTSAKATKVTVEGERYSSPHEYTLYADVNIALAVKKTSVVITGSVTLTLA